MRSNNRNTPPLDTLSAMSADQSYANALADPDAPPLTESQLNAFVPLSEIGAGTLLERLQNLKKRAIKKSLTVRYDADVVAYYQSKGKGYQQAMNDALRACMEAEKGFLTTNHISHV